MTVLSLFTEYPFVALLYRKYKCHCWSHGHIYMKSNSARSLLQNMHNSISKVYTYMHIAQELFTSIYIMHGTVHLHFHPWHRVLVRGLYKPFQQQSWRKWSEKSWNRAWWHTSNLHGGGENGCDSMNVGRCMWWMLVVLYLYIPSCPGPQSELNERTYFQFSSNFLLLDVLTPHPPTTSLTTHPHCEHW